MAKSRMWLNWIPARTSSNGQPLATSFFSATTTSSASAPVNDGRCLQVVAGADQPLRADKGDFRVVHHLVVLQPVMDALGNRPALVLGHDTATGVQAEADHVLS